MPHNEKALTISRKGLIFLASPRGFEPLSTAWHAVCNAHIIRELPHGEKRDPEAAWALLMRDLLLRANEACTTARSRNKASLPPYKQKAIRRRFEELLAQGEKRHPRRTDSSNKRRIKQPLAVNLLDRLRRRADAVLCFIKDLKVPFSNNPAEQTLRRVVLREKVSGYFATPTGAQDSLAVLSLQKTGNRRGVSAFSVIKLCQDESRGDRSRSRSSLTKTTEFPTRERGDG